MMHEGSVITDVAAGPGESVCVLVGAETINLRYWHGTLSSELDPFGEETTPLSRAKKALNKI